MKPAQFEYTRPKSLQEAVALLSEADANAKVIAGGQSLGPMLNLRLARPGKLVDIRHLPELRAVRADSKFFAIGATLTHAEIAFDGHMVAPQFQYRLQIDFAETPILKDGFLQVGLGPSEVVRVGQFKVPYAMQRLYYSGELEFVDVSVATAAFSLERDVGVMLAGRPFAGRLRYQVAVLNGAGAVGPGGAPRLNDNLDLAYAVRIVASPFGPLPVSEGDIEGHARPLLAFGVAGYYNLNFAVQGKAKGGG